MLLLAAIHLDLAGPERLEYFLQKIKPKRITIEWPSTHTLDDVESFILANRRETIKLIQEMKDLPPIYQKFFLDLFSITGYDTLTPLQYARRNHSEIYGVDHPKVLKDDYPPDQVAFQESIRAGMGTIPAETLELSYNKEEFLGVFDQMYQDPTIFQEIGKSMSPQALQLSQKLVDTPAFEEEREQYLTDKIKALQPDLHIGGIAHAFEGYGIAKPLFRRLGELVTERIRLCDAYKKE